MMSGTEVDLYESGKICYSDHYYNLNLETVISLRYNLGHWPKLR